ncbi:MAG: primosomal protein N' [Gemmatimonadales bacterium]|jgi:primosomal protein N' (replication factor Y)
MHEELLQTEEGDARGGEPRSERFARVALPLPLRKTFTYRIPADLAGDVFVGRRVDVPFGRRVLSGIVTDLTTESDVPASKTKAIRNAYETYLPRELLDIAAWIATYYGCSEGEAMQSVLPPSLRRARVRAKPTGLVRITDAEVRAGGATGEAFQRVRGELKRAKKQLALFTELAGAGGAAQLSAILNEWGSYARAQVDALVEKGLVTIEPIVRTSPLEAIESSVKTLTAAQQTALDDISGRLDRGGFHPVLLYGVTGSGKTEVYLRAARRVLEDGGGCIVLVPEIGLLPQATARYRRIFGDDVAIIHSRLTGPERFDLWERVERGQCRIVVGPRSAVFSPVRNLRMIIVDEEQDDSYKQDDKPRYHARSVALMRGKLEGLTVVLGSATPSAESTRHARDGRYNSLLLPQRAGGGALPDIELVDMRNESRALFSTALVQRLERNIERGHESIIFLNKRGHARFVQCNSCGWVATCRDCDISLTFHRVDHTLKCHFCGFSRRAVDRCDACKGSRLFFSGIGTQRVELELGSLFPGVAVLRMDADTTSGKEGHQRILEEFSTGNYPILLGTQMVTKGHHFPGVNLVGVLYAEEGLNFPDFRSAERTYQQLTQVAGRSGRGDSPGTVIIQTYMPDHYAFRFLQRHDYDGFMAEELSVRESLGYPPFSRIVLASASATHPGLLAGVMHAWAERIRPLLAPRRIVVLGPAPPLVARVKNRYREQILIKGAVSQGDKDAVLAAWNDVVGTRRGARAVDLRWDVDPESFF